MRFESKKFDWVLLLISVLLLSLSVTVIFTGDINTARSQFIFSLLGLSLFFGVALFDYNMFRLGGRFMYVVIALSLLLVLFIGEEVRGSFRWFVIGPFNVQPSELMKPILILFFSWFASTFSLKSIRILLLSVFLFLLPALLLFRQPDLGNVLVYFAIWFAIMVTAGVPRKYLLWGLSFILLVLPEMWLLLREYQKQRIFSFLNPYADPLGTGYNVIQSTIAVGSGQLFGRGLGRGTQSRLQFLPEYHTDFIFATLAEELGFFGSVLLLFLFFFLIFHVFETARSAPNTFGVFIAVGVGTMILFQVCVNVGMNIGIIPITGITLPLVSYGGSSLLSTLMSLGLVASVFRKKRQDQALRLQ